MTSWHRSTRPPSLPRSLRDVRYLLSIRRRRRVSMTLAIVRAWPKP